MPRPLDFTGVDGLPLWDTFEVTYFLLAGLTIGVISGFLFPSLWRAFRRRFRDVRRFDYRQTQPLYIHRELEQTSHESEEDHSSSVILIERLLVHARHCASVGRYPDAVQTYLKALGHERISKQYTNQVFMELSHVYAQMNLFDRCLDVSFELLGRKPKLTDLCFWILQWIAKSEKYSRVNHLLDCYQGDWTPELRIQVAHLLCQQSEKEFSAENSRQLVQKAARFATHSARPKLTAWKQAIQSMNQCATWWPQFITGVESRCRISWDHGISPKAESELIAQLWLQVAIEPEVTLQFQEAKNELSKLFNSFGQGHKATVCDAVISAWICAAWTQISVSDRPVFIRHLEQTVATISASISNLCKKLQENEGGSWIAMQSLHQCQHCKRIAVSFEWRCQGCGKYETLKVWPLEKDANESFDRLS